MGEDGIGHGLRRNLVQTNAVCYSALTPQHSPQIAVSRQMRRIDLERIAVVCLGFSQGFRPLKQQAEVAVRERRGAIADRPDRRHAN